MQRCIALLLALIIVSVLLAACQFIPNESTLPTRPNLHTYKEPEYETETVMRGDLLSTISVRCRYVHAKKENLSFSVGGVYINKVYVTEGQQVKAGQLLAELEHDNLYESISSIEYQVRVLEQKKTHIFENRQLEIKKHEIILGDLQQQLEHAEGSLHQQLLQQIDKEEQRHSNVMDDYSRELNNIEDSIYIQRLRLEEAKESLKQRQIIAGMDGTVTYVVETKEGMRSVKGETVIRISDLSSTVFTVTGNNAEYFEIGTDVVLTCHEREYAAFVADPSAFGFAESTEENPIAYLKLKQPDPTLEEGDYGSIIVTLEQEMDVLYVDADAVHTSNGETFVFMLDEEQMRIAQKVTTGMEIRGFIEIVEGLREGDKVIVD